jgi:hypothetical protein
VLISFLPETADLKGKAIRCPTSVYLRAPSYRRRGRPLNVGPNGLILIARA